MEGTKSVKEVLVEIVEILGNISVQAKQLNEIGMPIGKAINGLNVCIDAINRAEAEQAKQEEPVLELVPEGEAGDA